MAKNNTPGYLYFGGILGGILVINHLTKKKSKPVVAFSIDQYKSSYYFDCTSFKIINQEKFTKFNDIITEKVFKEIGGSSSNLLEFSNYVIGFTQKYMQQISDLQAITCNLEMKEVKIVYFILGRDSLAGLKKFGQKTQEWNDMFDEVIGGYVDIWMQYLKIPKEESVLNEIADKFEEYREMNTI